MSQVLDPRLKFVGNKVTSTSYSSFVDLDVLSTYRLDCDFYGPTFADNELRQVRSSHPRVSLQDLATTLPDGSVALSDGTHDTIERLGGYLDSGYRLITSGEVANGFDSPGVYISEDAHRRNRRSEVRSGDLLVAVRGSTSVGTARLYPTGMPIANMNTATARVRLTDKVDSHWVVAFLNSYVGRINSLRLANGVNQLNMNMEELAALPILTPPMALQRAIGNKMRKAERLRAAARQSWQFAVQSLEEVLGVDLSLDQFSQFSQESIFSAEYQCRSIQPAISYANVRDELGAQYFHPRRVHARLVASRTTRSDSLANVATRIHRGAEAENGFVGLDAIDSTTGVVDPSAVGGKGEETGCSRFKPRDILFSRLRPYLNKVTIWPSHFGNGRGSGELLVYRTSGIDPYYLFLVIKSALGLHQVIDVTAGSTHPRVDAEVVDEMLIPRLDENDEARIGEAVSRAHSFWYESQELVPSAKKDVESLVDGTLNESELLLQGEKNAAWLEANPIPERTEAS